MEEHLDLKLWKSCFDASAESTREHSFMRTILDLSTFLGPSELIYWTEGRIKNGL